MEFMKQNVGPEVIDKLKETVFQRRTIIRRIMTQILPPDFEKIPKLMPRLFDIEGMVS